MTEYIEVPQNLKLFTNSESFVSFDLISPEKLFGNNVFEHAEQLIKLRPNADQLKQLSLYDKLETYKTDHIL